MRGFWSEAIAPQRAILNRSGFAVDKRAYTGALLALRNRNIYSKVVHVPTLVRWCCFVVLAIGQDTSCDRRIYACTCQASQLETRSVIG